MTDYSLSNISHDLPGQVALDKRDRDVVINLRGPYVLSCEVAPMKI